MNLDRLVRDRQPAWTELESLIGRARGKPERLGPDGVRRLGSLYRATAADLALARARFSHDPVVPGLEALLTRARVLVYDSETRRESALDFFARGYWRRVHERPGLLLVAASLTFGPAILAAVWAGVDPGAAGGVVPGAYRAVTEPRPHGANLALPILVRGDLAAVIFTNNVRVAFLAFAGGITAGLLTGALLVVNGFTLGVVAGLAAGAGNGRGFYELVVAHGVLELSCIVIAGAAGLRVGMAILDPGMRRRSEVVVTESRRAVEIAVGTAPWLVVAGLVEGFLTPAGLGLVAVSVIGLGLGLVFWALVAVNGRTSAGENADGSPPRRPR